MVKYLCRWFLPVFLFCSVLAAQSDQATVRGTAKDQTGAVVPSATIEITNVATNIARKTITNEHGDFEIPYLNRGTYRLTATATGFKSFVAESVILSIAEIRRIDVTFQLGDVTSAVTVTAGAGVIQTEGSQIANNFSQKTWVNSAASADIFPETLMASLPNVQNNADGWTIRVAGQPSQQMSNAIDGVSRDTYSNQVRNMAHLEEVQLITVNASAEYARVINETMVSPSGTNQIHGRAYYQMVNSALAARPATSTVKPSFKEHHAGIEASGPIVRDKTFFYVSYSPFRFPGSSTYQRNVPTFSMRDGDFSAFTTKIKDPLSGTVFPNNVIPASRINSTSSTIQDLYIPEPNQGGATLRTNNYSFIHPYPTDAIKIDVLTGRVDHKLSEKNTIYARYTVRTSPYVLAGCFPEVGSWTRERHHHSIVVSDTHIFSPSLVNTARWGWLKDFVKDGDEVDGFTPVKGDEVVKNIGLQGVNAQGLSAMGFPTLTVTGITTINQTAGGVNQDERDFSYADSLTWSTGRHVFKFGGEWKTFRYRTDTVSATNWGSFTFNSSMTGDGYGDFLLGLPYASSRIDPLMNRVKKNYELGFYVTDTFKITPKLSVDYGLRWDYFGPSSYNDGLVYNWNPASGAVIVPEDVRADVSSLYPSTITIATGQVIPSPTKSGFRPRVGFGYQLKKDLVIRGGYGMFSESEGNYYALSGSGPFEIAETYYNTVSDGAASFSFPNPFPTSITTAAIPSQSVTGYPMEADNGVIHQFNLSVERQIGSVGLRASYIGSRSRGMHYSMSTNKPEPSLIPFTASRRPYPQFVGTTYYFGDGKANYDSAQFEIQRKMKSLTFDAHYTLASNLYNYSNLQNPYDHYLWNRDTTARHRGVVNVMYELPFGRGRAYLNSGPAAVNFLLGGWTAGWTAMFQSGFYFSPSFSGSDPSNTNTSGGLPDRIADGNLDPSDRTNDRWFDASAFAVPQKGHFGNSGVDVLEGPGLNVHHLSLSKEFRVKERFKVTYQAYATDAFNHPNWRTPNANISVPSQVGKVTTLLGTGT
ncbi:MAG: carboxypeptidase regulatory-like domain-containing protein, partial [Bryobacteraceae bacterium]